jgi:hypothetical protein
MDLRPRLELAGVGLLAILNPEEQYLPTGGYEVAHDLGRWWDAALRLEQTLGFEIPEELEAVSLRNLRWLTDNPDRLLLNSMDEPSLAKRAKVNPHNFRETFLAYDGLIRRRPDSDWAREGAMHLVRTMTRMLQPDGRLDFEQLKSSGDLPPTKDPSHCQVKRGDWFDGTATGGRAIESLVWLYETTGEAEVLDLVTRLAAHHLAYTTNRDGSARQEIIETENSGHNHSYHGTLRGLLLFGLLTGQQQYVDTIEATYRHGIRNGIVKESGWTPHDLGLCRFPNEHGDPVADPASTGDAAQLALWLATRAGCDDLFDDVERLVRARLLPVQLTDEDIRLNPDESFAPRTRGAWRIHNLPHAGKGCVPDVHAAIVHSLCDIHANILTRTAAGVRINLHFDTEDENVAVTSTRDKQASVTVAVKQPENLQIRIPGWAPAASLRLTVDGKDHPLQRSGSFAMVAADAIQGGSNIALTFDLPERQTQEQMPSGRRYRFAWRGDEIIAIDPQDTPQPFYPPMANRS